MEKLLKYCLDTIKSEWILTGDYLFVGHDCLSGALINLVCELKSLKVMIVYDNNEGVLFAFTNIGICNNKAKLLRHNKGMLNSNPNYIKGSNVNRLIKHKALQA